MSYTEPIACLLWLMPSHSQVSSLVDESAERAELNRNLPSRNTLQGADALSALRNTPLPNLIATICVDPPIDTPMPPVEPKPRRKVSPARSPIKTVIQESILKTAPQRTAMNTVPQQSGMKTTPQRTAMNTVPHHSAMRTAPQRNVLETAPHHFAVKTAPLRTVLKKVTQQLALKPAPKRTALKALPQQSAMKTASKRTALKTVPQQSAMKTAPQRIAMKAVPHQSTVKKRGLKKVPQQSAMKTIPKQHSKSSTTTPPHVGERNWLDSYRIPLLKTVPPKPKKQTRVNLNPNLSKEDKTDQENRPLAKKACIIKGPKKFTVGSTTANSGQTPNFDRTQQKMINSPVTCAYRELSVKIMKKKKASRDVIECLRKLKAARRRHTTSKLDWTTSKKLAAKITNTILTRGAQTDAAQNLRNSSKMAAHLHQNIPRDTKQGKSIRSVNFVSGGQLDRKQNKLTLEETDRTGPVHSVKKSAARIVKRRIQTQSRDGLTRKVVPNAVEKSNASHSTKPSLVAPTNRHPNFKP